MKKALSVNRIKFVGLLVASMFFLGVAGVLFVKASLISMDSIALGDKADKLIKENDELFSKSISEPDRKLAMEYGDQAIQKLIEADQKIKESQAVAETMRPYLWTGLAFLVPGFFFGLLLYKLHFDSKKAVHH